MKTTVPTSSFAKSPTRRYPRSILSAPLTLRHLDVGGVRKLRGITLDVSESGMGALVQGDLALGEAVEIDLHCQEQDFNAVAIVRHTSDVRSGFEFLGMTSQERAQIAAIINRKPEPFPARRLGY